MKPFARCRTLIAALCGTLALLGGLVIPPASSVAATDPLHVTDCGDAGAGTLRGQIAAALNGDTIVFDRDCTITLTLANGMLSLTKDVTIDATGHTVVVDGSNAVTVFTVGGGVTARITALTIQNGNTASNGGGINNSGMLTVTNSTLSGNHADDGGGIYNLGGTVEVANSTLSGNSAGYSGGGVYSGSGAVTLTHSILSGNTSANYGGGIANFGSGTVALTGNSTLTGNSASYGGGIFNYTGTATVTNSTLSDNRALGADGRGGGIDNLGGTLTVADSTLSGNRAPGGGNGGGIFSSGGGMLAVTNSTLTDNSATNGSGGVENHGSALTVTNSTFSGNSGGVGGGIYSNGNAVTVTNSTLSGNSAIGTSGSGGINNEGGSTVTVTNTIAAGNNASNGGPDLSGTITSGGHNLFGATSGATITLGSGDLVNPNPLLGDLGAYGSVNGTQTFPLLPGSPAIDAGAPVGGSIPPTDQRGRDRVSAPDIGAFESRGFTLTKSGGDNQSTPINIAFASPLAVAVAANDASEPVANGRVAFTALGSGASATLGTPNPATVNASGQASVSATANATPGAYTVTAAANGAASVDFALRNIGPVATLSLTGYPSPTNSGDGHPFTVTAKDAYGNVATAYTGTVHFTSTDPQAILPADYTFVSGDSGAHTFSATFRTVGTQSVTATDTHSPSVTGSQAGIAVQTSAPAVAAVSPSSGSVSGRGAVTITGTGFLSGAMVMFGGTAATNVVVVNATTITATVPAYGAGAVNVVVTNADHGVGTLTNGYTYGVVNALPGAKTPAAGGQGNPPPAPLPGARATVAPAGPAPKPLPGVRP